MVKITELKLEAMGSFFEYKAYEKNSFSEEYILNAFNEAHKEVKRIENKFTDFKESPFNQINENAGIRKTIVDKEIMTLILRSFEISKISEGRFDISFASVGHRWRYYKKIGIPFPDDERNELQNYINYKKVEVDKTKMSIFLPHQKMRIGLGGIGKGYAVDRAYNILKKFKLNNFYINGSGDIKVSSNLNAPRKWKIGIKNPFNPSVYAGLIQVSNQAVSTSGNYNQYNPINKADHHIIRIHNPQNNIISATVIHENCLEADCYGTILMTMNVKDAITWLNKYKLSGTLIDQSGASYLSKLALSQFGK